MFLAQVSHSSGREEWLRNGRTTKQMLSKRVLTNINPTLLRKARSYFGLACPSAVQRRNGVTSHPEALHKPRLATEMDDTEDGGDDNSADAGRRRRARRYGVCNGIAGASCVPRWTGCVWVSTEGERDRCFRGQRAGIAFVLVSVLPPAPLSSGISTPLVLYYLSHCRLVRKMYCLLCASFFFSRLG